jgi:hypothetical protein
MAYHAILECLGKNDKHFTGVTVTNDPGGLSYRLQYPL